MPSQEEMRNEGPVLFGKLDILKKAREAATKKIAEQEWSVLTSFLNKYAGQFPQVVLALLDEGYQNLTLARLLGKNIIYGLPLHNLLMAPTHHDSYTHIICLIDEKQVYRYVPEINPQLSRDEISVAARACISARLKTKEEVPQVVIPDGFLAFRFDALWAAGGHNDDYPKAFEAVIEAKDIHSGFDIFHERLGGGMWRGQKNFVGNFWVAFPSDSGHPHCGKWHRLELVSEGVRNPPMFGHYWGIEFDWPKVKLGEKPITPFPRGVA